jgi:pyrophosphatase PpaX
MTGQAGSLPYRHILMPSRAAQIRTILFDWDGTVVDSAALGLAAFQKTFADLGFDFPLDIYEANYSPNWYSTYEALGLPKEKWQKADQLWLQHYGDQAAQLIDGAADTLFALHERGYQLGVVSSGSESRVFREIQQSEVARMFVTVICNEHLENKKPHPEGLHLAMEQARTNATESAYVGDAPEDIEMGKRVGVLTIGVRSLYPCSSRLVAAQPDILLESLSELVEHFPRRPA